MGIVRTIHKLAACAFVYICHDTCHLQSRSSGLCIRNLGLDEDIAIVYHCIVLGFASESNIEPAADNSGKAGRHCLRTFAFEDDADIVRHAHDCRILRISDDAGNRRSNIRSPCQCDGIAFGTDDEVADFSSVSSSEESVNVILAHIASPTYSGDTVAFAIEFTGKGIDEFICRGT